MLKFDKSDLKTNKEIKVALKILCGISWHNSTIVTARAGIGYPFFLNKINHYMFGVVTFLLKRISETRAEWVRRRNYNIQRLEETRGVRGFRHKLSLPVHGQRTHTNARTQRLNRHKQRETPEQNEQQIEIKDTIMADKNKKNKKNKK